jgi:putative NADPH-quinone reductase
VIVIVQLLGARQHHGLTTVNPRAGLPRQGRRVPKRILIVDGHPDSATARLSHALAAAYAVGAREAGADLRIVALSGWPGAFVRSGAAFKEAPEDAFILEARAAMMWAEHVVLVFPLWLGGAPSLVRAFLEQITRAGFALAEGANGPTPRLKGRSARLIVTMGMPALAYRLMFGAHGVRAIAKSILGLAGVAPVRMTLFGMIETKGASEKALRATRRLGHARR